MTYSRGLSTRLRRTCGVILSRQERWVGIYPVRGMAGISRFSVLKRGEACILSASCFMQEITFEILIDAEEDSR